MMLKIQQLVLDERMFDHQKITTVCTFWKFRAQSFPMQKTQEAAIEKVGFLSRA